MPHQCVKCDALYPDDAPEVMTGCACGSKAFLFLRQPPRELRREAGCDGTRRETHQETHEQTHQQAGSAVTARVVGADANTGARASAIQASAQASETMRLLKQRMLTKSHGEQGTLIVDAESAESIVLRGDGAYDIDIDALLHENAVIYRHDDGKYSIDLEESFRRHLRK